MMRATTLLAILVGCAAAAAAAVPDAVRQLPWRRAVVLAPAPSQGWHLVELDSLVAATTRGDLACVRLVDQAGEAVPAVALAARWPEIVARPLVADDLAWRRDEGEDRLRATLALPPGRYVRAAWSGDGIGGVSADAPVAPIWSWDDPPAPDAPAREQTVTWDAPGDSLVLTVGTARAAPPALALERLDERRERRRAVPFAPRPGVFRGTEYEQVIDLPAGPHPVVAVALDAREESRAGLVTLDARDRAGRWQRLAAERRDGALEVAGALVVATHVRLGAPAADPPNPPFAVTRVEAVPPALAIPPDVAGPLWLVYGEHPVPAPAGLPRERLERVARLEPARLGPVEANPWFEERFLGATWLRRRPLAVTAAMVAVLAVVAWLVVGDRRAARG